MKILLTSAFCTLIFNINAQVGLGVKAPNKSDIYFDGTRKMLDAKWTYWNGPRLKDRKSVV